MIVIQLVHDCDTVMFTVYNYAKAEGCSNLL